MSKVKDNRKQQDKYFIKGENRRNRGSRERGEGGEIKGIYIKYNINPPTVNVRII